MLRILLTLSLVLCLAPASAHDHWANGRPIPEFVKHRCCNGNDADMLGDASVVHPVIDSAGKLVGYKVDGFVNVVNLDHVYPSQDGMVWSFHWGDRASSDVSHMEIWCLFIPCYSRPDLPLDSELEFELLLMPRRGPFPWWADKPLKQKSKKELRQVWRNDPSPQAWAERERAYRAERDLTAMICGDPLPGRSALDRERK